MTRTNLRNVQRLITEAAEAGITKWTTERERDAEHIKQHAEASRVEIDLLARQEQHIIEYIEQANTALLDGMRKMFFEMREREQARLAALIKHVDDFTTDEPALEQARPKQLNGGKS